MSYDDASTAAEKENTSDHQKYRSGGSSRWSLLELVVVLIGLIVFLPLGIIAIILKLVRGKIWSGSPYNDVTVFGNMATRNRKDQGSPVPSSKVWASKDEPDIVSGDPVFDAYRNEELRALSSLITQLRQARNRGEFEDIMMQYRYRR